MKQVKEDIILSEKYLNEIASNLSSDNTPPVSKQPDWKDLQTVIKMVELEKYTDTDPSAVDEWKDNLNFLLQKGLAKDTIKQMLDNEKQRSKQKEVNGEEPTILDNIVNSVENNPNLKDIVIQTSRGSVNLPVAEMWQQDGNIVISVDVPDDL